MKLFSSELRDAMARGDVMRHGAIYIASAPVFAVWGGYETREIDGVPFIGVGDRAMVSVTASALGASAQNVTISLSGIDPATVSLRELSASRDAPVALYRLYFNGTGARLLGAHIFRRGRLDQLVSEGAAGGPMTVSGTVETAARGLGKRGARMCSDADQQATFPGDRGYKAVSFAGEKTIYFGGEPPNSARAAFNPMSIFTG